MKKLQLLVMLLLLATVSCSTAQSGNEPQPSNYFILETDIGNDVDDALALDMVYKYHNQGKINLVAIMTNKEGQASMEYLDIMNTWYNHPNIPIGTVKCGSFCETDAINYAQAVCNLKVDGEPAFARTLSDYSTLPEAYKLYRQVLSQLPDGSVTIATVGFSTNLARLLNSSSDEYSTLSGRELVAKKVKLISAMAGSFSENPIKEYNVVKDIPAAQTLFANSPAPIITSPFEVGIAILYPATSIENDFGWAPLHPMVEAYKAYLPMPYDRPTWDLTSVLLVAEPETSYMGLSAKGTITVDDQGYTHFKASEHGLHQYLTVTPEQAEKIKNRLVELISTEYAR